VREGKLLALVGGEAADVERTRGVLDHLTRRIVHIGPNGAGCAMKLAVNLGMAVYLQSLAEALSLGQSEGLTLDQMLEILGEAPTASPWLKSKLSVLKGDPGETTLDIRTMRKDVMSAIATGARNGVACRRPRARSPRSRPPSLPAGRQGSRRSARSYFREFMLQVYE